MESEQKTEGILLGIGHDQNALTVQKSQPLLTLWRSGFQLNEFKLLDLFLSRIDSHHPENRTVVFTKGEIESVLGIQRIRNEELRKIIRSLMQPVELPILDENGIPILDEKKNNIIDTISLFERTTAIRIDDVWTVRLKCTEDAMRYVFNVENLGYLRYKLAAVRNLRSRYSYVLFCYLESNRFRKSWDVDIEELKNILGCADVPLYEEYRHFSSRILKRSQIELAEKSNCIFTYAAIKQGRNKVIGVHFILESIHIPLENTDDDLMSTDIPSIENIEDIKKSDPFAEMITFFGEACDNEFTYIQMQELVTLVGSVPVTHLPPAQTTELARFDYLRQKYLRMLSQNEKKKIQNRYKYLLTIIQNDMEKNAEII